MNKLLLRGLFPLSFSICEPSSYAMEETHECLSIVHKVPSPKSLRSSYEDDVKEMRKKLGTSQDREGYNWKVPMTADRDLHLSLVTFAKGEYGRSHVDALRRLLTSSTTFVPHNGYFLRAELWLHKKQEDKTVVHTHFVHPADLTLNEKKGQYYDPEVRSLETLTSGFTADSGHLVLRYATDGKLSTAIDRLIADLQNGSSPAAKHLEVNRDKYGSNLISHLTVARIVRVQGEKMDPQQVLTGSHIMTLKGAFEDFRRGFQGKATMQNPKDSSHKVVPYSLQEVHLTSGVRESRKILHTVQ